MKYIIVAFAGRTRPYMRPLVAQSLHIVQIADQNLMIHSRTQLFRPKKEHRVQIRNIDTSRIRRRTLRPIFLHMHAEEHNIRAVDFLERKNRFCFERILLVDLAIESTLHHGLGLAYFVHRGQDADCNAARLRLYVVATARMLEKKRREL